MIGHRFRNWISTRLLSVAAGAAAGLLLASVCPAAPAPQPPAANPPPAAPPKPADPPKPPAIPPGGVTPAHVDAAIAKAQNWFLKRQNKEWNWEEAQRPEHPKENEGVTDLRSHQWGGLSSLAVYALLGSGMDPRDEKLHRAINWLLTANINSTYGLGLSSQIVDYIPAKESTDILKRNVLMLLAGMYQPSRETLSQPGTWHKDVGFYHYWVGTEDIVTKATWGKDFNPRTVGRPQPAGFDRSNSQYGVLGMWALEQAGGEVPTLYWQIVDQAWRRAQLRDGGWNYNNEEDRPEATPSMTAAGIATLFISSEYTSQQDWSQCKGGIKDENIERGLAWMDHHIDQAMSSSLYTLYGIERIGTASGRKYFGTSDWYKIGMDRLVRSQRPDGSWAGDGLTGEFPSTAFALVFLARGRAPVLMNKLEYGTVRPGDHTPEPWDERPRDIANLAKFVGHENETYLNWQVVNLKVSPEELHDSPILYIAGNEKLDFSKEEEDKLRAYINEGGMILGNDDCGKGRFGQGFKALGKKLFPQYQWKQTPLNDFIYNEQFKSFRYKPMAMELTNGVRKLMLLIPEADPSRAWQTKSTGTKEDLFGLGDNIFLYAVDKKNLLNKGETYLVKANEKIIPTRSMKVARLEVGENPNPEPGGWPRLAAIMRNKHKLDVQLAMARPTGLAGYKVADLTGTGKVSFSSADRTALKQFVDTGGTLIVDAAGGDPTFADSAEEELNAIFPAAKVELLSPENPVYHEPGATPERIGWRSFAVDKIADKHHAKLRGIMVGKRVGVFFSREDLSAGIVGEPVDGIYGYDPTTATDLMAAMLLYADNGGIAPVGRPVAGANQEARAGGEK